MSAPRSRPTSARRKSSSAADAALEYECKAAYLVIVDDTDDSLLSMNQLRNGKITSYVISYRILTKSLLLHNMVI